MSYIRHIPTGEIYPMNENLMRRGDMEVVEDEPVEPVAVAEVKKAKGRKAKAEAAEPTPEPVAEDAAPDADVEIPGEPLSDLDLDKLLSE